MKDLNTYGLDTVDSSFEDLPEDVCAAAVMGGTGDLKVIWKPTNEKDVKAAAELFDDMRAKRYLAFRVKGRKAEQGEQINEFDPKAGRLIFVPAFQGG